MPGEVRRPPPDQDAVLATLALAGDRWTFLILREAFFGVRRFSDLQRILGIARTPLSERLGRLVADGVLERVAYQEKPVRHEYRLTELGRDFFPLIVELLRFGERWLTERPTLRLTHRDCGGQVVSQVRCARCGEPVDAHGSEPEQLP
ncbi:hypothetical protein GCM10023321_75090 [Pseudonocardia eucalypti]|uniref:HTH hxlR-type domain-containing protein n=1 Tax=Pseudonocardia eucalypti TaxID=648755 RepID=A0ABP9RAM1_9PSEU|nr:DNA-binding HxlR family transcriptional regulator [Pseudonocardia eucalypti]